MITELLTVLVASFVIVLVALVYLLPVLAGWARHVPDLGSVAVVDLLLGWTLVGWVVALALALRSVRPQPPVLQLVQNLPPSSRGEPPPLMLPPRPADPPEEG